MFATRTIDMMLDPQDHPADSAWDDEAFRNSETLFRLTIQTMQEGFVLLDGQGIVRLCNPAALEILGLSENQLLGRATLYPEARAIMPDGQRLSQDQDPVRHALLKGEKVTGFVMGLTQSPAMGLSAQAGETTQWVCINTAPLRQDGVGLPYGAIATLTNITAEVAHSDRRFRILFEKSPNAHLLIDESGIVDCNEAALALLGATDRAQVLASHPADLSPPAQLDGANSADAYRERIRSAKDEGLQRFEWTHLKLDGTRLVVETTLTPVGIGDCAVILAVWNDLTERKRTEQQNLDYAVVLEYQNLQLEAANARLEALATTDGLTGLKNRQAFEQGFGVEFMLSKRSETPLSTVLMDVDHFKQFNDVFGHPAGDDVLKTIARILRQNTRPIDLVARYGGEEFVIVFPETPLYDALEIVERIRLSIEREPWSQRPITASFGIADLSPGVRTEGELVSRADAALYRAKADGRNRIATNTSGMEADI